MSQKERKGQSPSEEDGKLSRKADLCPRAWKKRQLLLLFLLLREAIFPTCGTSVLQLCHRLCNRKKNPFVTILQFCQVLLKLLNILKLKMCLHQWKQRETSYFLPHGHLLLPNVERWKWENKLVKLVFMVETVPRLHPLKCTVSPHRNNYKNNLIMNT